MWRVQGRSNTVHPTSNWAFVWDLDDLARPAARIRLEEGGVGGVALSRNGTTLYTSQPLIRHDLTSGSSVPLEEPWGDDGPVEVLAVSPADGALAASGPGGVVVLDPTTGEVREQMQSERDDSGFYISFSRDGSRLATVAFDSQEALVWAVSSGDLLARLPLGEGGDVADFGGDNSTLFTAGDGSALRRWDIDGDRRFIKQVAFAPLDVGDLGFVRPSPGGRFIAFPMEDRIAFFDVRANTLGKPVDRGTGYHRRTASGSWHPDGVHFALVSGGEIRVWDARTGDVTVKARPASRFVTSLDYSTDGSRMVIGELSGRVTMLDATTLEPVGRPVQLDDSVVRVAAGPDNNTAFVLTGFENPSGFWVGSTPDWALLDLESGVIVDQGPLGFLGGPIDFSPDGQHVAVAGRDGEVAVLDLASREPVREPVVVHDGVSALTYSADGSRFLTSGFNGDGLWDGATGELLSRVVTPQLVTETAFGSDPATILIAPLFGGAVYEWDTRGQRAVEFACRLAGRDFTEQEWTQEFGDRPFQQTCPGS